MRPHMNWNSIKDHTTFSWSFWKNSNSMAILRVSFFVIFCAGIKSWHADHWRYHGWSWVSTDNFRRLQFISNVWFVTTSWCTFDIWTSVILSWCDASADGQQPQWVYRYASVYDMAYITCAGSPVWTKVCSQLCFKSQWWLVVLDVTLSHTT